MVINLGFIYLSEEACMTWEFVCKAWVEMHPGIEIEDIGAEAGEPLEGGNLRIFVPGLKDSPELILTASDWRLAGAN